MIVYITTNLINGKKYIGSDSKNNPKYLGSGVFLNKAIKKYGKENFKKEILAKIDSIDIMKELEEYYIEYYNAYNSDMFYNATKYSSGITSFPKDKIKNIINANKGNKYNLGRKSTPYNKLQTKKANSKPINQYDLNGNFIKEWPSITEASNYLKGFPQVISSCLLNINKTAYGYVWKFKI
jgi:hypothetical protein